jgi:ferric-dicitrate binding protein FerR (iron transport regulator)
VRRPPTVSADAEVWAKMWRLLARLAATVAENSVALSKHADAFARRSRQTAQAWSGTLLCGATFVGAPGRAARLAVRPAEARRCNALGLRLRGSPAFLSAISAFSPWC